ncbi:hypothetical protein V6N12_075975 [Hibiscus sabdariffa]|uniref:Uncharacterized protein n=1 Tax=Hibiscus sabdariffa TaxID=183260 RepID=A0ABR2AYH8_9ROSI
MSLCPAPSGDLVAFSKDRRSHIKLCLDELLDAQSGQASLIGTIAPFPLPFRSRSCTLSLAFMVGKTSQEVLDGVPGRGKGIQCLRRQQKCKLEVTDILRGVFIGRNSSTHPAQRYKIGVNMLSNRNPQMNNHLSGLPRIDFFAQPLSQRGEKWRIGKGFLGDSSGSCALEVDMSETPCLSASIPLRSRQQARIYVVEDGSEEGIPQSESTDLAHGVSMACPLGSSERN